MGGEECLVNEHGHGTARFGEALWKGLKCWSCASYNEKLMTRRDRSWNTALRRRILGR
jgi:hypothetical protein